MRRAETFLEIAVIVIFSIDWNLSKQHNVIYDNTMEMNLVNLVAFSLEGTHTNHILNDTLIFYLYTILNHMWDHVISTEAD